MNNNGRDDLRREIEERMRDIPPAPWVVDMIDHYQRTGWYRPSDLRRLLGDPTKGVEVPIQGHEMEAFKAAMDEYRASR